MGESTSDTTRQQIPSAQTKTPLETLSTVCQCLLQLEDSSAAHGVIDVATGGMLRIAAAAKDAGWTDVAGLCELGDEILEAIRGGTLTASSPVIDALLEMCETMASIVGASDGEGGPRGIDIGPLTETLQQLLKRARATEPTSSPAASRTLSAWPAPGTGLAPDAVAEFKADSMEGLELLEAVLLVFERNPRDMECLRTIFRVIHNIKGAADYVGLPQIKTLSHRLEDVLDLARAGRCEMTASLCDLVFRSVDELKAMIAALVPDGEQDRDLAALVLELEGTKQIPATEPPAEACPAPVSDDDLGVYASSAEQQLESIAACCSKLAQGDASDAILAMIHRGVTTLLAAATYLEQAPFAEPARELLNAIQ
jgi:chemotaxis protein histidine kinase CheA